MAKTAYPFDGQETTEDQYSRLFSELQDTGVAASASSNALRVSSVGTNLTVDIAPGAAYIRGRYFESTAIEQVVVPPASSGTATHRIVLRLDPLNDSIDFAVVQGTPGAGPPTLANDPELNATGIWELGLAAVTVSGAGTAIAPSAVVDERRFTSRRVGIWARNAARPAKPRLGEFGYNVAAGSWEFHKGNDNWEQLGTRPAGIVEMTMASTTPAGYLPCDGSEYAVSEYPALAAVLGATGTTFRTPDLRDRMPIGTSVTKGVGTTGGSDKSTIAVGNLPPHRHSINHDHGNTHEDGQHHHSHWYSEGAGSYGGALKTGSRGGNHIWQSRDDGVTPNLSSHSHKIGAFSGNSGETGGGAPLDVMNPWLALRFIIKV